jgi:hypothetical protein
MSTGLYAGITGPGKPQLERLTLVSHFMTHDSVSCLSSHPLRRACGSVVEPCDS